MSLIQSTFDQARQLFLSMPMSSRVTTVLLSAAISVALAFLFRGDSSTSHTYLYGGASFSDEELAAVARAFSQEGLNDWEQVGNRMKIPATSKASYYAAIADSSDMPLSMRSRKLDAIDKTNMFESNEQRRAREMAAKELELERSLQKFHSIRSAQVEFSPGERIGLGRKTNDTCSVMLEPYGSEPLSRDVVRQVQDFISKSFSGLTRDNINITDVNGQSSLAIMEEDPMMRKKMEY
ncbi:MAG: beta-cystathionase, partial [Planctomycetota bacterium]